MRHVLVVANQTAVGTHLTTRIYALKETDPDVDVFVLVPATPRSSQRVDEMRRPIHDATGIERASRQLKAAIEALEPIGVSVRGQVGDPDPMKAVKSVMETEHFDHIIVSTLPLGASRWLNMDLPHRLERRYRVVVDHVVGTEAGGTQVASTSGPTRILLVEDQPADVALTKAAFKALNQEIDIKVAPNGAEALEYVRTYGAGSVDLVLLDLKMPVLDGHQFLAQLAEEGVDVSTMNIAIVTTSTNDADRERAHALGASAYVLKDPDFDAFTETLGSLVAEVAAG